MASRSAVFCLAAVPLLLVPAAGGAQTVEARPGAVRSDPTRPGPTRPQAARRNAEPPGIQGLAPSFENSRPGARPGAFERCRSEPALDPQGRQVGTRRVCR